MFGTSEKKRHVLQLRNVVFSVPTVLCEQWEVFQVLSAGVGGVKLGELPEHHPPGLDLLLSILYVWYGLPTNTYIKILGITGAVPGFKINKFRNNP